MQFKFSDNICKKFWFF